MSIPQVTPFTKVPNINESSTFEEDTNTFLNQINQRYTEGNAQVNAINAASVEIDTKYQAVINQAVDGGYSQAYIDSNFVNNNYNTIVLNGDFSNGTADWEAQNGVISIEGGRLKVECSTGESFGRANQNLATEVGATYKYIIGYYDVATATQLTIAVGGGALVVEDIASGVGNRTYTFTATSASTNIQFLAYGSNLYSYIDDVSCFKMEKLGEKIILTTLDGDILPTSDPLIKGAFWNDSGTVKISTGV